MDRSKIIIRTSAIGITVNVILSAFKMAVGFFSNSIAIVLDAVNNLGDALSSIITVIGAKLADRPPDRKHPYGYGRVEYVTSAVIASIVLAAGLTSLQESVKKTVHPVDASYAPASLVIISAAVIAKLFCGYYTKSVGKRINAGALVASGSDAILDAVLSFSTLVAAAADMIFGVGIEGILGIVISLAIIKAGLEMLGDALNSVIGMRVDKELGDAVRGEVCSFDGVRGAYDLALHSYGPSQLIGSIHIEVDDAMPARDVHKLTRGIAEDVYAKFGIILTVGIYASNTSGEWPIKIKASVNEIISDYGQILQMHGFYADSEAKSVSFDLVIDFGADFAKTIKEVSDRLKAIYPEYSFNVIADKDYSD